ncbi:unnamed protein product [Cylicostephanus goldi]|uniref:Uncharacterized protein n=1 Tax=Cylicostephanus goldi TaxID=71465 RepID=A0A3P6THR2_CYLGO|nr:unnamed protein product [Cylicostephanus goldi]
MKVSLDSSFGCNKWDKECAVEWVDRWERQICICSNTNKKQQQMGMMGQMRPGQHPSGTDAWTWRPGSCWTTSSTIPSSVGGL